MTKITGTNDRTKNSQELVWTTKRYVQTDSLSQASLNMQDAVTYSERHLWAGLLGWPD